MKDRLSRVSKEFIPVLFIFTIMVCNCLSSSLAAQVIDQKEAIRLAENFIKENGYTMAPADTSNLTREFIYDYGRRIGDILKLRYNSLYMKAFCVSYDSIN